MPEQSTVPVLTAGLRLQASPNHSEAKASALVSNERTGCMPQPPGNAMRSYSAQGRLSANMPARLAQPEPHSTQHHTGESQVTLPPSPANCANSQVAHRTPLKQNHYARPGKLRQPPLADPKHCQLSTITPYAGARIQPHRQPASTQLHRLAPYPGKSHSASHRSANVTPSPTAVAPEHYARPDVWRIWNTQS